MLVLVTTVPDQKLGKRILLMGNIETLKRAKSPRPSCVLPRPGAAVLAEEACSAGRLCSAESVKRSGQAPGLEVTNEIEGCVLEPFTGAFTIEVAARFDDLSGTNRLQRIFDFGNGPRRDNIVLA